jgi:hypothetical protein
MELLQDYAEEDVELSREYSAEEIESPFESFVETSTTEGEPSDSSSDYCEESDGFRTPLSLKRTSLNDKTYECKIRDFL